MKKIIFAIFISIISVYNIQAQAPELTHKLFGTIESNEKVVPYATVRVVGTTTGSSSRENGTYKIGNLPKGKYEITATALGYKPQTKTITITGIEPAKLNFTLQTDLIGLEEVVVSSNRNAESRKNSSVIVNAINSQVFEMSQTPTLIGGLDFTPGLRTESNCQNCGFSQVRMNGLEGPYSQILINSRPIFSGLAGVYGLELFPANMVERIEVVRGGGSALYGGNAIAGTINIITKEPTHNTFSISSTISATGIGHDGIDTPPLDKNLNVNASMVSKSGKKGITVYGMMRDRDAYDQNGDGYSEEVLIEGQTFGFSTFYKPTIRTKLNVDFYNIKEFRRGGNKFDYLPHETGITEQVDHNITGTNLSFDLLTKNRNSLSFYTSGQSTDRQSYYGAEQDPNGYGTTIDFTASSGLQYTINTDFISNS
ncbi:MAG: carboxypeptidase-like regulatory domain-containing protein, partial [Bacteroidota bacterium]|nr:carboxypeptidase-like regulatory domain-containing protein [Bacteroidota bacterium]